MKGQYNSFNRIIFYLAPEGFSYLIYYWKFGTNIIQIEKIIGLYKLTGKVRKEINRSINAPFDFLIFFEQGCTLFSLVLGDLSEG